MSRKDCRKALAVHLPDELRLRLIEITPSWRPLPALMRQALVKGLDVPCEDPVLVAQGQVRPVSLQLSRRELRKLHSFSAAHDIDAETAALTLIRLGV